MRNKVTYKKVEGKNLIEGNTYYLDSSGTDKAIYRGRLKDGTQDYRCLFDPIGDTCYSLYTEGRYEGMFSIWNEGFFYEKIEG